jgi:hypothetical protein
MNKKIHIVVDLEAWGTRVGSDARSIGACVFNPNNPADAVNYSAHRMLHNQEFYVAVHNPLNGGYLHPGQPETKEMEFWDLEYRRYNLTRDKESVEWWQHPDRVEAAKGFVNAIDLRDGCESFAKWLYEMGVRPDEDNSCIWGHGAAYDPPVLAAWYRAVGLPIPWYYRAPRDTRTCFDDAGIEDHSKWLARFRSGVYHNALDDAITEAAAINAAKARIAVKRLIA